MRYTAAPTSSAFTGHDPEAILPLVGSFTAAGPVTSTMTVEMTVDQIE